MSTASCVGTRHCGALQSRVRSKEAANGESTGLCSRMDKLEAEVADTRSKVEGRAESWAQLHDVSSSTFSLMSDIVDRIVGRLDNLEAIAASQKQIEKFIQQLPQHLEDMLAKTAPMRSKWSQKLEKLDNSRALCQDNTGQTPLRLPVPADPENSQSKLHAYLGSPVPADPESPLDAFGDVSQPKLTLNSELVNFRKVIAKDFSEELERQLESMSTLISRKSIEPASCDNEQMDEMDPEHLIDAMKVYENGEVDVLATEFTRQESEDVFDDHVKLKIAGAFGSMLSTDDLELEHPENFKMRFYKNTGWCQAVVRSDSFNNMILICILLNAAYLACEVDWNDGDNLYDASMFFIVCDHAFCMIFFVELCIRFFAFRSPRDCLRDGWFRFDAVVVGMTAMDTWVIATFTQALRVSGVSIPSGPFRLLRMARLTRMSKVLRVVPELNTMTRALYLASRAVVSAVIIVVVLMFVVSVMMVTLFKGQSEINANLSRYFSTMFDSMFTLFINGTLMDEPGAVMTVLKDHGSGSALLGCFVFLLYTIVSAILVMNMLIGVLCEVVSLVTRKEKDEAAVSLVRESILVELRKCDDGDGMITRKELDRVMHDRHSKAVLRELNVDILFLTALQSALFQKKGESVSIKSVIKLMLMCRGDLPSTVQHVASGQAFVHTLITHLDKRISRVLDQMQSPDMQRMISKDSSKA